MTVRSSNVKKLSPNLLAASARPVPQRVNQLAAKSSLSVRVALDNGTVQPSWILGAGDIVIFNDGYGVKSEKIDNEEVLIMFRKRIFWQLLKRNPRTTPEHTNLRKEKMAAKDVKFR